MPRPATMVLARAAHALGLAAVAAGIAMQALADEWLPPENSVSQYANSRGRWAFVAALLSLGLAVIVVAAMAPRSTRRDRVAAGLLTAAGAGFVLAALVPAPPLGDESPLSDAMHQAGAIVGTFALTVGGLLLAARSRDSSTGRAAFAVATVGAVALGLLTLVNFDIDVVGLGRRESWALHQSISLVCMVIVVLLLPAALRRPRS